VPSEPRACNTTGNILIVVERDQAQPPRCFHICPSDSAEPLLAESLTTATQWQPRVLAALVGIAFASEAA